MLIQEGGADSVLDEIWDCCTLLGITWECIARRGDHFVAIYLTNLTEQ